MWSGVDGRIDKKKKEERLWLVLIVRYGGLVDLMLLLVSESESESEQIMEWHIMVAISSGFAEVLSCCSCCSLV